MISQHNSLSILEKKPKSGRTVLFQRVQKSVVDLTFFPLLNIAFLSFRKKVTFTAIFTTFFTIFRAFPSY